MLHDGLLVVGGQVVVAGDGCDRGHAAVVVEAALSVCSVAWYKFLLIFDRFCGFVMQKGQIDQI